MQDVKRENGYSSAEENQSDDEVKKAPSPPKFQVATVVSSVQQAAGHALASAQETVHKVRENPDVILENPAGFNHTMALLAQVIDPVVESGAMVDPVTGRAVSLATRGAMQFWGNNNLSKQSNSNFVDWEKKVGLTKAGVGVLLFCLSLLSGGSLESGASVFVLLAQSLTFLGMILDRGDQVLNLGKAVDNSLRVAAKLD